MLKYFVENTKQNQYQFPFVVIVNLSSVLNNLCYGFKHFGFKPLPYIKPHKQSQFSFLTALNIVGIYSKYEQTINIKLN